MNGGEVFDAGLIQENLELAANVAVEHREILRDNHVEQKFPAALVRHNAEIVQRQPRVNLRQNFVGGLEQSGGFGIIGNNRVDVNYRAEIELGVEAALDFVNNFVGSQQIGIGGHFDVHRGEAVIRTVVVDNQIVDAENFRRLHDEIFNFGNEFGFGRSAKQRVGSFLESLQAAVKNKHCHENPSEPVGVEPELLIKNHGDNDDAGRNAVHEAVGSGGEHRGGVDFPADRAIKNCERDFDGDRTGKHGVGNFVDGDSVRIERGADRTHEQIDADENNRHGHENSGEIFRPAVAEWMALVSGLRGDFKSQQHDNRRAHIRETVEGVGD